MVEIHLSTMCSPDINMFAINCSTAYVKIPSLFKFCSNYSPLFFISGKLKKIIQIKKKWTEYFLLICTKSFVSENTRYYGKCAENTESVLENWKVVMHKKRKEKMLITL